MSGPTPEIVVSPEEVTPAWMSAVLQSAGHDVRVSTLRHEAVGTGQMAHNERFHLSYEQRSAAAPASVVGKFPSPNEESRASGASGGYRSEVRFYTDLAPDLSIPVPRCFYGAVSDDSTRFTLILEDMAPAEQGDQLRGASPAQLEAAIVALAGLHGPRWGDPALHDIAWMISALGEQAEAIVQAVTPLFLARFDGRLSKGAVAALRGFGDGVGRWLATMPGADTVVHGDYRLDNLLFASEAGGAPVTAVDWQTVSITAPGRDVGFLLGTSSDAPERRAHEAQLLEAYRKALASHGVELSADEVQAGYRHGSFQGPFITMLGAMAVGRTERGDAMFVAMAERCAALIHDLEALDLICA